MSEAADISKHGNENSLAFRKKIGHFLLRVLLLGLCFLMTLLMGLAILFTVVNTDMIADGIVENFVFKGISAADISAGKSVDAQIAVAIRNELEERYSVSVDDEQLQGIMEQLDVSGFLQNYLDRYTDYIKETGHLPELDINEYVDIIETNKPLIEYVTGKKLNGRYYKYQSIVVKKVNEYNKKARSFNEKYDKFSEINKILSKDYVSAAVGTVIGLLFVLYAYLRRKRGYKLYTTFRVYTFMFIVATHVVYLFRNEVIKAFVKTKTVSGAILNKMLLEIFEYPAYTYITLAVLFAVLWVLFALPYYKRSNKLK